MKFFIDTANLDQIREANDLGILDGVTTNPKPDGKEGIKGKDRILQHYIDICNIVEGDVSALRLLQPIFRASSKKVKPWLNCIPKSW
jgi:hypothetical protein